jgi:hypothetical protein
MHIEPLFHAVCPEGTESLFEGLVADNFWEIGSTGRKYSRAFALDTLESRQSTNPENWQTSDYHLNQIGESVFLLTYTLQQPNRTTLRLTIWEHVDGQWKAIYNQGTVVQA